MRNRIVVFGLLCVLSFSCEKENSTGLRGIYNEFLPVAGRSQLNFISNSRVIIMETAGPRTDTFYYDLSDGQISLRPAWSNQYDVQHFYFEIVDDNTIKVGNLYPSLPNPVDVIMEYRK